MTAWADRSDEEKTLLNPSFSSILLWHAARGHERVHEASEGLAFEAAFLILPFVLHRETRDNLPRTHATSLAVWLDSFPLTRSRISDRARLLVPFTKEAMTLGGTHGLISFEECRLSAEPDWRKQVGNVLAECSEEVQHCAKRAEFVGGWFAKTGSNATLMALLGVRP